MFAFPVSRWVGGVFFEHVHRLIASFVGLLTIGLAVWFSRPNRAAGCASLGDAAVGAVILQGVLGGLRVVELGDWMGIFHACLAQAFLALVSFIALANRAGGQRSGRARTSELLADGRGPCGGTLLVLTAHLIFLQLALGAAMRHAHAGLSIPDFPKAYGHWWPQVHKADLPALNRRARSRTCRRRASRRFTCK